VGCQQEIVPGLDECKFCHTPLLKPCPFCKERIKVAAVKCKFCHADLGGGTAQPPRPQKSPEVLKLESDAQLSCILAIVALIGFPITAPFAWYIGGRVNKRLQQLGLEKNQNATVGWIIGMVITLLAVFGILVSLVFIAVLVLGAIAAAA
jgi:hypothetical protein